MSQKIVVNRCFGGFSLSDEACKLLDCEKYDYTYPDEDDAFKRDNQKLVEVVEQLGEGANGPSARLQVVEIPDDVGNNWHIDNYDGRESIHENHRSW